ncbi:MAG: hypothetical protein NUW37_14905 [Planctomycetes bacterium]|nr:hypothetical protein [Planctomycetota bacterium]
MNGTTGIRGIVFCALLALVCSSAATAGEAPDERRGTASEQQQVREDLERLVMLMDRLKERLAESRDHLTPAAQEQVQRQLDLLTQAAEQTRQLGISRDMEWVAQRLEDVTVGLSQAYQGGTGVVDELEKILAILSGNLEEEIGELQQRIAEIEAQKEQLETMIGEENQIENDLREIEESRSDRQTQEMMQQLAELQNQQRQMRERTEQIESSAQRAEEMIQRTEEMMDRQNQIREDTQNLSPEESREAQAQLGQMIEKLDRIRENQSELQAQNQRSAEVTSIREEIRRLIEEQKKLLGQTFIATANKRLQFIEAIEVLGLLQRKSLELTESYLMSGQLDQNQLAKMAQSQERLSSNLTAVISGMELAERLGATEISEMYLSRMKEWIARRYEELNEGLGADDRAANDAKMAEEIAKADADAKSLGERIGGSVFGAEDRENFLGFLRKAKSDMGEAVIRLQTNNPDGGLEYQDSAGVNLEDCLSAMTEKMTSDAVNAQGERQKELHSDADALTERIRALVASMQRERGARPALEVLTKVSISVENAEESMLSASIMLGKKQTFVARQHQSRAIESLTDALDALDDENVRNLENANLAELSEGENQLASELAELQQRFDQLARNMDRERQTADQASQSLEEAREALRRAAESLEQSQQRQNESGEQQAGQQQSGEQQSGQQQSGEQQSGQQQSGEQQSGQQQSGEQQSGQQQSGEQQSGEQQSGEQQSGEQQSGEQQSGQQQSGEQQSGQQQSGEQQQQNQRQESIQAGQNAEQQMQQARQAMENLRSTLRQSQFPQVRRRQEELNQDVSQLNRDLQELRNSLPAEEQQALQQATDAARQALEEMERAERQLRDENQQSAADRQADAVNQIEQLLGALEQSQESVEESQRQPLEGLAPSQEELRQRLEEIRERLERQRQQAQGENAQRMQQAQQSLQQASQSMQQASQSLSQMNSQQAQEQQQQAEQQMSEAQQQLENTRGEGLTPEQQEQVRELENQQQRLQRELDTLREEVKNEEAQQSMQNASAEMQQAQQNMERQDPQSAQQNAQSAQQEMQEAADQLEEERQRYEEQQRDRLLLHLENKFQEMLDEQRRVLSETTALNEATGGGRFNREQGNLLRRLDDDQEKIHTEADATMKVLEDENAVIFKWMFQTMIDDLKQIDELFDDREIDGYTQGLQQEVINRIEEMIDVLRKERENQQNRQNSGQPQAGQMPQGQNQRPPLVPPIAELEMIRRQQEYISRSFQRLRGELPEQAENMNELQRRMLRRLSHQQGSLRDNTRSFGEGLGIPVEGE